jgi:hypothetical protein
VKSYEPQLKREKKNMLRREIGLTPAKSRLTEGKAKKEQGKPTFPLSKTQKESETIDKRT